MAQDNSTSMVVIVAIVLLVLIGGFVAWKAGVFGGSSGDDHGKLIDVDGALSMESRVDACWVQLHAGAPWGQLVARDTAEVGGIDK